MRLLKHLATCATALALSLTVAFASAQELAAPTWSEIESKDNLIRFAWNEVEGADEYRIEKLTNGVWGDMIWTTSNTSFGWKCHYESKSPFTYRSETFRVVAISSTGVKSAASSPFTVQLADGTPYSYLVGNSAGAEGNTTRTAYVQPVSNFDQSVEERGQTYVLYFGGGTDPGNNPGTDPGNKPGIDPGTTPGTDTPSTDENKLATPVWKDHSVTNTAIKLEWTKVDSALDYTLYYKEASAKKFVQRVVVGTSTVWYGIKGKTYDFYLVANPCYGKGLKKSDASATKTILLDEAANPKQPLPTPTWTKHSVKNTEIKLEWSKVADALNYTLYYKEASAKKFLQRVVATNSTTYYGVKGKSYDFFVVANPKYNDGYEVSAASETKTVLLSEAANPNQPLPTPTWKNVSVAKTKISLEWTKVDAALNYTLYYKEASAKKFFQRVVAGTSTTYYGVNGKIYEFYVVANPKYNDGYVVSAASETRGAALFDAPKTTLATPTWTNVSASKTKISLSWTKVDDALNYSLFYKEATAKNYVKRVVAKTSTTYTGIKGKTYEFYVVANPKCGSDFLASSASGTQTITLDGSSYDDGGNVGDSTTRLPAPVLSYTIDGTKIVVSWNAVDNARAYKFFWKEKSATNFKNTGEIKTTQYQITGEAGKTYVFYAVALPTVVAYNNGSRQSANSETLEAALGDFVLNGYATGNTIMLSWTPVADAVKYTVFNASGETPVEVGTTDDANASMTGKEGETYKLYVCAYDETGAQVGEESNTITVKIEAQPNIGDTIAKLPTPLPQPTVEGLRGFPNELTIALTPPRGYKPATYQVQYLKYSELEEGRYQNYYEIPEVNYAAIDWSEAQTLNIPNGYNGISSACYHRVKNLKKGDLYVIRARVIATEADKNNGLTSSNWSYARQVITTERTASGTGQSFYGSPYINISSSGAVIANGNRYPEGAILNTDTNVIYTPIEGEEVWTL